MVPVIYKIINLVNDNFYVGSTVNKKVRFRQHRKLLRENRHHCKHLQAAWNKYGEAKFDFVVVEEVADPGVLWSAEERWLTEHHGKAYCYNSGRSPDAPWRGITGPTHPNFGRPMSGAQKQEISQTLKGFYAEDYFNHPRVGKTHTEETRAQISAAKRARPSRPWLGKERSQETKDKISAKQRGVPKAEGRKVSEEGRAKIRANIEAGRSHRYWVGKKHTPEAKLKMSKAVLATSPEGVDQSFVSLQSTLEALGLRMPTLRRALVSGQPLTKGPRKGWSFRYAAPAVE